MYGTGKVCQCSGTFVVMALCLTGLPKTGGEMLWIVRGSHVQRVSSIVTQEEMWTQWRVCTSLRSFSTLSRLPHGIWRQSLSFLSPGLVSIHLEYIFGNYKPTQQAFLCLYSECVRERKKERERERGGRRPVDSPCCPPLSKLFEMWLQQNSQSRVLLFHYYVGKRLWNVIAS